MTVQAVVDQARRDAIRRAHSATHLLHYALQKNLGSHAQQQGSKVSDDWLRFDFTNLSPVSVDELDQITGDVREKIRGRHEIRWATVPLSEARAAGAMMLFGEKYPDPVRMVSMGQFSRELCGGTHLNSTQEVGAFEIISEEGISAGTRRIAAVTGQKAKQYLTRSQNALQQAAERLAVAPRDLPAAVKTLTQRVRELKKELAGAGKVTEPQSPVKSCETGQLSAGQTKQLLRETARLLNVPLFEVPDRIGALQEECEQLGQQLDRRRHQGTISVSELVADAEDCQGVTLIVAEVPMANANLLRQLIDQARQTAAPCVVVLGTREGESKVTVVAGVSREVFGRVQAGQLVREIASTIGGGGGGNPSLAQAGGKKPEQLAAALEQAPLSAAENCQRSGVLNADPRPESARGGRGPQASALRRAEMGVHGSLPAGLLPDDFQLVVNLFDSTQLAQGLRGHLLLKEGTDLTANHHPSFAGFTANRLASQVGVVLQRPLHPVFQKDCAVFTHGHGGPALW